jgi:HEAT repeat protein
MEDQLLRLELLNLLAILKATGTKETIREYLSDRSWEISATAAISLLMEGDESAIDIVRQILQDPQPRIRLKAALILSMWSREESAIKILEEGYSKSEWEMKARILEGIGRIGSTHSIPFLIQVLKEPSQTLRLIAAMALIQCLNH